MSREQAAAIARSLRDSPFDPGGDAVQQRVLFARLMAARPRPAGVVTRELRLGGTPLPCSWAPDKGSGAWESGGAGMALCPLQ